MPKQNIIIINIMINFCSLTCLHIHAIFGRKSNNSYTFHEVNIVNIKTIILTYFSEWGFKYGEPKIVAMHVYDTYMYGPSKTKYLACYKMYGNRKNFYHFRGLVSSVSMSLSGYIRMLH